ncbi:MAG: glycosyltransferase [Thermoanaerobaculia bacterium]
MGEVSPVAVVYVTRNRRDELAGSLESLGRATPGPSRILVVDNASADGTAEWLRREHPEVEVVAQDRNLGVATGRTVGIEAVGEELVLCLDDDARLESADAFARVGERFDESPQLAVLAFRIVNARRGETLGHEFPRRRLSARGVERRQEVAYFIGCGFAARRSTFLEAGGFNPLLHYGLEELDLSYRLLEAGHRLLYDPAIVVRHRADPGSRRDRRWYFHMARSRIPVVLANLPLWAAVPHLVLWHGGLLAHGLARGHASAVVAGAAEGWRLAPRAWRKRRPISPGTAWRILRLSGRLFF